MYVTGSRSKRVDSLCGNSSRLPRLSPPAFMPNEAAPHRPIFLAVETFRRHMTDEAWQLQIGLRAAGYDLWGRYLENDEVRVPNILAQTQADTVIVQDTREWDPTRPGCFDKTVRFQDVEALTKHPDLFRVTVCKDAHQDPVYQHEAYSALSPHAWITYYHPGIVMRLCSWLREEHLIRTYHSIDSEALPEFNTGDRKESILSGALNRQIYPLRHRLYRAIKSGELAGIDYLTHPGYGAMGRHTPAYLRHLAGYKIAICTTSIFGYALRKLIEATAVGCVVVTDLPEAEVMPEIQGNLVRVDHNVTLPVLCNVIHEQAATYDTERQRDYARRACKYYDYRYLYGKLADQIASARASYLTQP